MEKLLKKWEKIVFFFLLAFSIFVCGYVTYHTITAATPKARSSQGFLLVEMILGIATIFVPAVFTKLTKLHIPAFTKIFYWIFILLSVYIGTGLRVISNLSYWDKILHLGSAMMLVAVGYGLLGYFLKHHLSKPISPFFYLIFGFAFAMMCGVIWEFYEFTCDSLLGMNLQRFAESTGKLLVGRAALMDTMGDLWTNTIGAIIFSGICYLFYKKDHKFYQLLAFQKNGSLSNRTDE